METLREQNIHENKKALRARCREIVKGLSPEYIEDASHKIASLVLATDAYKNSNTIFCYMSMGGEPVTDEIIERALEDGKRVGIPLCVGPHEMVVKEYKNGDELARGAFGIREPLAEAAEITAGEFDLAIVPCVACSTDEESGMVLVTMIDFSAYRDLTRLRSALRSFSRMTFH